MSAAKLTSQERRQVGDRYQAGESMPQLAEAYGVGVGTIERALTSLGIPRRSASEAGSLVRSSIAECRECGAPCHPNAVRPLCPKCAKRFCESCVERLPADWKSRLCSTCKWARRYQKRGPRLCRICGRMVSRGARRLLCAVHIKLYCTGCEAPLPPGRVNDHCTNCERERKARLYAKSGRLCAFCGIREVTTHASRCSHCKAEDYEIHRWAIRNLVRPCVQCGVDLAKGRRLNRCPKCHRRKMRERNKRRQAIGAHRCAMCREPLSLKNDTYCNGCSGMLAKWRKAWHAGCTAARRLGAVRPQRRWQETKAA